MKLDIFFSIVHRVQDFAGPYTKRVPVLHRTLVFLYHLMVLELIPRSTALFRKKPVSSLEAADLQSFLSLQRCLTLRMDVPAPATVEQLKDSLEKSGCRVIEGGWTFYIPPSDGLMKITRGLDIYPAGSGLKILKDINPPESARYAADGDRTAPGASRMRARTPLPAELLRIAAHLDFYRISPATHDLVAIDAGGKVLTAFVCEHVEGRPPVIEDYSSFTDKLDRMLEDNVIGINHENYRASSDFSPPGCNGNLIVRDRDGTPLFVDVQSFRFENELLGFELWMQRSSAVLSFGRKRIGKNDGYMYQTIPGFGDSKRGTLERWNHLDRACTAAGLDLDGSVVFDIGCNSGLMSYYALSRGARWCFGWDREATAAAARRLMKMLGATRFTATGTDIEEDTDFLRSIPDAFRNHHKGILFLFSICHHVGMPAGLFDLPWRHCVFEGATGESIDSAVRFFSGHQGLKVAASDISGDGDSLSRPLLILERDLPKPSCFEKSSD